MTAAATEQRQPYLVDEDVVRRALQVLESKLRTPGPSMSGPPVVTDYLRLQLGHLDHEVFGCLFLDVRNRLIANEPLFRGTLTATSVYPREILKLAMQHNACSVILYHNHPSGNPDPSTNDKAMTLTLKQALALVDVKVLDHFIVAGMERYSFAEHGEI